MHLSAVLLGALFLIFMEIAPLDGYDLGCRARRWRLKRRVGHLFVSENPSQSSSPPAWDGKMDEVTGDEMDTEDMIVSAMKLLDVMTCPANEDDPEYDVEKDVRRDDLLLQNNYEELKLELRRRGLRTNGDKPEMIIRVLLNIIDPSVKYMTQSGMEPNLQYVGQEDIDEGDVTVIDVQDRSIILDAEPDADDVKALGGRSKSKKVRGLTPELEAVDMERKVVMDGLSRRELEYPPLEITRSSEQATLQDKDRTIRAYVSGGRDVLRSWERRSTVVVVVPDERGWRDKDVRIFADEIAFNNQVVVIVPDVHAGGSIGVAAGISMATADVAAWRQQVDSPACKARTLDDIISTLYFAREEYGAEALCMAGVGHGAGRALMSCGYFGRVKAAFGDQSVHSTSQVLTDATDDAFLHEVQEARRLGGLVASGLLSDNCKLSTATLVELEPRGCFAVTPEAYPVEETCSTLTCAPFIVLGSKDDDSSLRLLKALKARGSAVPDFSIRVYDSRGGPDRKDFVHRSVDEEDVKSAQEAMAIGCIWLDIFSRDKSKDMTTGTGETKDGESARVVVHMEDLVNPVRESAVAAYLHDDPDFVRNSALESPEIILDERNLK